tara:strand:- start:230 stop:403 length:174 start_codon:yes stop_codon:yes gene_type:complete
MKYLDKKTSCGTPIKGKDGNYRIFWFDSKITSYDYWPTLQKLKNFFDGNPTKFRYYE